MKRLTCYFSQSITLLKQKKITEFLKFYSFIESYLVSEHNIKVFNPAKKNSHLPGSEIYKRDLMAIDKSNFVVCEVSIVSSGVGQELTYSIVKGKPILLLYNTASPYELSEMVRGTGLKVHEYDSSKEIWKKEITQHIAEFVEELRHFLYLEKRLCAKVP